MCSKQANREPQRSKQQYEPLFSLGRRNVSVRRSGNVYRVHIVTRLHFHQLHWLHYLDDKGGHADSSGVGSRAK